MLQTLQFYLSYPFVRYALIVGTLIALCSSLLGVTLVLKRFSYIGDGLSHVAFGALAVATLFDLNNTSIVVMPVTVLAAILILRTGQNPKIHGDAAIAMLSVGSLAVGYLVMNLFSTSANISGDVCSTLFGSTSILTLTKAEVWLCVVMSIIVVAIFIFLYHRIFAVTFDENFARATGLRANVYNNLIAVIDFGACDFSGTVCDARDTEFQGRSDLFRSSLGSLRTGGNCAVDPLFNAGRFDDRRGGHPCLFPKLSGRKMRQINICSIFFFK